MDLIGNIYITSDKNILFETMNMRPDVKIISLDENNELGIDPNRFVSGSILLPPVEAVIAEVDGNEQKYDMIYSAHIFSDPVKDYMSSIIAFMYLGGELLLYYPDSDYNNTLKKMLYFILSTYGIHIGIINDPNPDNRVCYLDNRYEGLCLDLIYYYTRIIDWREYLYQYPLNLPINDSIMNILMYQIQPFGDTYEEKLEVINRLRKIVKKNPKIIVPITSTYYNGR